jgi:hypothetical protein
MNDYENALKIIDKFTSNDKELEELRDKAIMKLNEEEKLAKSKYLLK